MYANEPVRIESPEHIIDFLAFLVIKGMNRIRMYLVRIKSGLGVFLHAIVEAFLFRWQHLLVKI